MRKINSIRNIIASTLLSVISMVTGFIIQTIIIKQLGNEYLGINGLFGNIISMLSMAELGIGTAIIYNLYKPIIENDLDTIKTLMNLYKKCYNIIAIIIPIIGICIIPFLGAIVGKVNISENIYLIFSLFIIDSSFSYLLVYKRSILFANQKNYLVNYVRLVCAMLLTGAQVIVLLFTNSFVLFLLLKIFVRVVENLVITFISNKMFPYLKDNESKVIDKNLLDDIIKKVKALLLHKIGGFIVLGTDNIVISLFLGITSVGLYSNYNMIIVAINAIISQIFISFTASVGNMLVSEKKEKSFSIFKDIEFLNFCICSCSAILMCFSIEPFMDLWLGKEYILPSNVLMVLVINFYLQGMRRSIGVFKEAAGIYYEDRFIPLLESLINLVGSIVLVKIFGLVGIFIATILSTLILYLYSFPKYVYTKLFDQDGKKYIFKFVEYFIIFILQFIVAYSLLFFIRLDNNILQILVNCLTSFSVSGFVICILFKNTEEFNYFLLILKSVKKRILKNNM